MTASTAATIPVSLALLRHMSHDHNNNNSNLADWACGGQFNRCFEFVQLLANAFQAAQVDLIVFFDGTLKENKRLQIERNDFRQKTISVRIPQVSSRNAS